jgi:hypothetical protein
MARPASGVVKTGPFGFPESGQYFCGRKLIQQPIQDTAMTKFRKSGSSSTRASSSALLPDRATNAWAMGPSPMMYLPCPPCAGWYGLWSPPPIHFHPGWSGPIEGFGHGGYYTRDGRYGSVGHQQDRKASRQENQTVQNAKPDHSVSPKSIIASSQ